ncbi:uncharacterized protein BP5553_06896 [Venustampulla echinocandica]|uniref:Uncharacterized protein n=1 Tax=Venustampulla echinocandica TaxID=2656787 RepID=A0A370TL96_9HELO|nr:uncharacterized protein BP5553_06896 [Venustampulla echinocandica]RDL36284.1 hypothetical protein BP5553_06896 [Venustampulla echinocandica]
MANSTDGNSWDEFLLGMPPSTALSASLSPDSQSLEHGSISETGNSAEAQDWFSSAGNNITSLATIAEENAPHYPRPKRSPSKVLGDSFSPRRQSQLYVSRSEFIREIRAMSEKVAKAQENVRDVQTKLDSVLNNHQKLSRWTVDVSTALDHVAQQVLAKDGGAVAGQWHMPDLPAQHVADEIGMSMVDEGEWHMPEEERQVI